MSQFYSNISIGCTFLWSLILCSGCNSEKNTIPNAEEILSTFELVDGFQIELLAAEPLISDPVAMEIDEKGRMYVVEMHGYPLDKSGSGKVKLLYDKDGDGTMDHAKTFASDLKFPTGVLRWKNGLIVTDPPNVLYFEDKDDDGISDIRDTILTGFALANPQHNFNNPIHGIDNWIYIANEPAVMSKVYTEEFSYPGSEVQFYGRNRGPVLEQDAGGRRIRMKPDQLKLETTSSRSQFGHTYDQWGHQYLVSNANHIYQEVIQSQYVERNPNQLIPRAIETISDHRAAADVYPITKNPEHQLLTDLGVFTSACGIKAYTGGLFPSSFENTVFVAEPVSNLVHVDKLKEGGAAYKASRVYEATEFLASTDAWFRPVNHYIGPDGALYILDYYRKVIEHPEWMGEDVIQSGTLYDGIDQGRIFRVTPTGTQPAEWTQNLDLDALSDEELVDDLGHANSWYRMNAQRLILDRGHSSIVPKLKKMVESAASALGRLHAAWTLSGLEAMNSDIVTELLKDTEPGVRENGIIISESFLENPEIQSALLALQSDDNPRVRFQLLCTLGSIDTPEANRVRNEMVVADINDTWIQVAVLSAENPQLAELLELSIENYNRDKENYQRFVKRIVAMITAENDQVNIRELVHRFLGWKGTNNQDLPAAILEGLVQGRGNVNYKKPDFEFERNVLLEAVFKNPSKPVRQASLSLLSHMGLPKVGSTEKAIERSVHLINNIKANEADRIFAIRLLAISGDNSYYEKLEDLLIPSEPIGIQKASLQAMYEVKGQDYAGYLIDKWPALVPALRDEAVRMFLSGEESVRMLVEALENGIIDPSAIQWHQQVGMMAQANDELRKRSRKIFAQEVNDEDKKLLLEEYHKVIELQGDSRKGLLVFEKNCAQCHQISEKFGKALGPDLASIRNRDREAIMKDILDPSLSIADGYELWEVTLKDGKTKQGIISSETGTSINLRILGSDDEVISREDIEKLQAKNISVMPTGFENQIGVRDMADLLAFIKMIN